jgi:hypothetical protein
MQKNSENFNPELLGEIADIDESTFIGYDSFKAARDHLPVFKFSKP